VNIPAHPWLWSYHDVATHAKRRYTRMDIRSKLVAAGLLPLRVTHWNMLLLPLVAARRKLLPAPRSGSDVQAYAGPVDATFRLATSLERAWLRSGGNLACGSSILAVAEKQMTLS
jgi:hypothetical protein